MQKMNGQKLMIDLLCIVVVPSVLVVQFVHVLMVGLIDVCDFRPVGRVFRL